MYKVYLREYLGEVVREVRTLQGMTLSEVASRGFLSITHLSDLERGATNASFDVLEGVAIGLQIPLSDILRKVADLVEYHEPSQHKQLTTV
jgi:transcriptional regulator with XRE-family HTH domain